MGKGRLPRRLSVVLYADVVGFSRLTGTDEDGTFRRLQSCRELFKAHIERHKGRLIDHVGDSILAVFESAVDALLCAGHLQATLCNPTINDQGANLSYRIGLNLGDIIKDGDNVYGDGVNVAARLEGIAPVGGICISASLRDAVGDRLPFKFEDMGDQDLKNIDHPVHAYIAQPKTEKLLEENALAYREENSGSNSRKPLIYTASIIALAAVGILLWLNLSGIAVVPPADELSTRVSYNRASIAVLPFKNMSGDPEQEYFVDGITEDIITDFSRLSKLKVIAWNTSASYKGDATRPQQVGKDLGVAYVLDGSVRKSGDRLRITAQLLDADNGNHIWAERYDRKLTEVFELQDEVTKKIVNALTIRLTTAEKEKLGHTSTNNFAAYDTFLRGQKYSLQRTKESNELARDAFRRAIGLDPTYARAYGALAVALTRDFRNAWTDLTLEEARARALEIAEKAAALDQLSPQVYWALGYVYLHQDQYDEAAAAAKQAITLAPNYADGYGLLAFITNAQGRAEDAIQYTQKAMTLNPYYTYEYPLNLGRAYYALNRYSEAVVALQDALEHNENALSPRLFLAASYIRLGRQDDAEWEIEQIEVLNPGTTLTHLATTYPSNDQDLMNAFLGDLRKAGLPE